jgi:ParB family chromosome partitioning protein
LAREKSIQSGVDYGKGSKDVAPGPQAIGERAPLSRDLAAAAVGVGARSIQRAKKVQTEAPDLVPAIRAGHIKLKPAERLAKEDRETRDAVMSLVTSGEEKSVPKAVQRVKGGVPKALLMSESNEWYTPDQYVDAARYLMGGIDLDPASCEQANETVRAEVFYTKDDDGFSQAWSGRVWMNPPYGKEDGESNQSRWTKRLIDSYENGEILSAVFIVNAATSATWFQRFWDYPICFVRRRISFVSPSGEKNSPTQGNVFVYLGDDIEGFVDNFSPFRS